MRFLAVLSAAMLAALARLWLTALVLFAGLALLALMLLTGFVLTALLRIVCGSAGSAGCAADCSVR